MGKRGLLFFVLLLVVINVVALCAFALTARKPLAVSFLNVGQGDAVFIETPAGKQVLIDGGPDRSVLRQLTEQMGPLDRTIDVVVATHPDKDHIAGLADVFDRYRVSVFLEPDVASDTSYAQALAHAVSVEKGLERVEARRGMRIHLEEAVYLDVLFPDRDVDTIETNTGSIVLRLVHGESEFLLTGDAPIAVEDWLVALDGEELGSDVLKAGHHGSRTSTGDSWMRVVRPRYVVISAGKGNSYGHPHEEVVERIRAHGAALLSTMDGSVTLISDGKGLRIK